MRMAKGRKEGKVSGKERKSVMGKLEFIIMIHAIESG